MILCIRRNDTQNTNYQYFKIELFQVAIIFVDTNVYIYINYEECVKIRTTKIFYKNWDVDTYI